MLWACRDRPGWRRGLGEHCLHTGLAGSCRGLGALTPPFPSGPEAAMERLCQGKSIRRPAFSPASAASWFCGPEQTLPLSGAQFPQIRKGDFDSDLGPPKTPTWRIAPSLTLHNPSLLPQLPSIQKGQLVASTLQKS